MNPCSIFHYFLILFVVNFNSFNCNEVLQVKDARKGVQISKAINYILKEFYEKVTSTFIISAESLTIEAEDYLADILDGVLETLETLTVQLDLFNELDVQEPRYYNLLLIDSYESFRVIYADMLTNIYELTKYYLIFLQRPLNDYNEVMTKIFTDCWNEYILNVNIIIEPIPKKIIMYTYFPFSTFHCEAVVPVVVNYFVNGTMTRKPLFPDKTYNMNRCRVSVTTWDNPPYIILDENRQGSRKFAGIEGELLETLSEKMNFTINYLPTPENEPMAFIYPNGSYAGAFRLLDEGLANLTLSNLRSTNLRGQHFSSTQSYYQTSIVFVVRRGFGFSSLETLAFPFDQYVWYSFAGLCIIGLVIIAFLKFTQKYTRHFVVGRNNTTPFYNMIVGALGGQVEPSPRRNFARFILTIWIIGSIVLRGAYQGLLYDFIRTERVRPPPNTIDDVIQEQFDIIASPAVYESINNVPYIKKHSRRVFQSEIESFNAIAKSSKKMAVITGKDYFVFYNNRKSEREMLHVVKQRIFVQQVCMYFRKHSYLTETVNGVIMRFVSCGLTAKWAKQLVEDVVFKPPPQIPNTLTMDQVDGAFILLIVTLCVSFVIFLLELISSRVRFLKTILEFYNS